VAGEEGTNVGREEGSHDRNDLEKNEEGLPAGSRRAPPDTDSTSKKKVELRWWR